MTRYEIGKWTNCIYHTDGNIIFVREGLGGKFKAFVKPKEEASDTLRAHAARYKGLKWCDTIEEAQADLDALAAKKRWFKMRESK